MKSIVPRVSLSTRERQILNRVLDGEGTTQIAKAMKVSKRTVDTHRANIHRRMRTQNVAQLMRESVRLGLWAP